MKRKNLINVRKKQGFTQVQIADKAKISTRAYQQYEYGQRTPKINIAKRIAKILKCTVEDIF